MTTFEPRSLTDVFLTAMRVNREQWWRDVLDDPELIIMVREGYLSVYYLGGAVFQKIKLVGRRDQARLRGWISRKYLRLKPSDDPDRTMVWIDRDTFEPRGELPATDYVTTFTNETLALIKRNIARRWPDTVERSGVYHIVMNNRNVVDIELAIPGRYEDCSTSRPQMDIVALEAEGHIVRLTFWEAKLRSSSELTDRGVKRHVVQQIKDYKRVASRRAGELREGYAKLISDQIAIQNLRNRPGDIDPLRRRVVNPETLVLGDEPQVGLIVFRADAEKWVTGKSGLRVSASLAGSRTGQVVLAADDPRAIILPR